jgi:hypothetical protein
MKSRRENLHSTKLENLEEMHKFLNAYYQPKLKEDINHLNRPIKRNEIDAVIDSYKEESRTNGLTTEFYESFKN